MSKNANSGVFNFSIDVSSFGADALISKEVNGVVAPDTGELSFSGKPFSFAKSASVRWTIATGFSVLPFCRLVAVPACGKPGRILEISGSFSWNLSFGGVVRVASAGCPFALLSFSPLCSRDGLLAVSCPPLSEFSFLGWLKMSKSNVTRPASPPNVQNKINHRLFLS
ncbi:MAG: hypothetical protein H6577_23620 [Lewinellaceae bacterium]|nr:hypothetical protein [Saprospiraceae bacterium]MCB9341127.1 hypothetical protein [Lewinellaceae bacterium]